MEGVHRYLFSPSVPSSAVIKPHHGREDQAEGSKADRTSQSKDKVEDRDCLDQDEGQQAYDDVTGDPGAPVYQAVALEMLAVSHDTDKDVDRGRVVEDTSTHDEGW